MRSPFDRTCGCWPWRGEGDQEESVEQAPGPFHRVPGQAVRVPANGEGAPRAAGRAHQRAPPGVRAAVSFPLLLRDAHVRVRLQRKEVLPERIQDPGPELKTLAVIPWLWRYGEQSSLRHPFPVPEGVAASAPKQQPLPALRHLGLGRPPGVPGHRAARSSVATHRDSTPLDSTCPPELAWLLGMDFTHFHRYFQLDISTEIFH